MDDTEKQNDLKKSNLDIPPQASKAEIITKLFSPFSEKEGSKEFDIMKEDLIAYVTLQENDDNVLNNTKDEWIFKNLLYSSLEKNLIELMYIKKKEYRKERIINIFNWYQDRLKTFKDLRFINRKSYNDLDAVQDEDYFKEKLDFIKHEQDHQIDDDILKEQMSHRSAIFDKSLLEEFKRNHVYDNIFYKKMHQKLEKKSKMPKILKKKLKPQLEKPDRPVGTHTMYYTYKDGVRPLGIAKVNLNDKKILDIAAGGERERTFHTKLGEKKYEEVNIDKEIKSSYSYYRPNMEFSILNAEKKIAEQKNKLLREKRSGEELNKNIRDFGRVRAQFKANEEKKCELKKLVSIYTNIKKLDTPLLKNYRKNNFITTKMNKPFIGSKEEEQNEEYIPLNRLGSVSIKNLTPFKVKKENQLEKKFYSKNNSEFDYDNNYNDYNIDPEEEKKKKLEEEKENMNIQRKMKKKYTFSQVDIAKKFRRIDGDKIIINEARNCEKKTKELIDNPIEKIKKIDLKLKFKKLDVKQKLIKDRLNIAKEEEKKFPNDLVYQLVKEEPTFGSRLNYKSLCGLDSIHGKNKNQNESAEEEESLYNNFCLSAFNIKNNKILSQYNKQFDSDVKIMRHISSYTKFNDRKKLLNRNDSFNDYRYNYLDLRKTIGEFKKYEYEEIMNRLSRKKEFKEEDNSRASIKIKDPFHQKITNIRYRKQKVLSSALMNPNESNTFPKYFLPRTGTTLISKNEPPAAKKKKRRRR